MDLLEWLIHGTIPVPGGELGGAREVIGNLFGLASVILGMKRLVGLADRHGRHVLLFTVFATGELSGAVEDPLWGQAGRQVFFAVMSLYGWWRWSNARRAGGASDGGAMPRWATRRAGPAARARCRRLRGGVRPPDAGARLVGPATEAWILAGSMLATYGMARGWVEFWLIWILVDIVGVVTLIEAEFYPTAGMYLFYAVFVVIGFVVWVRASRTVVDTTDDDRSAEAVSA